MANNGAAFNCSFDAAQTVAPTFHGLLDGISLPVFISGDRGVSTRCVQTNAFGRELYRCKSQGKSGVSAHTQTRARLGPSRQPINLAFECCTNFFKRKK